MSLSLLSVRSDEALSRFQEALRRAEEAVGSLGTEALAEAVGEAERLRARLWTRLYSEAAPRPQEEDRLLDVEEAAGRLAVSLDTLYRRAGEMPFTVRIGGSLRFSSAGIQRFIRTRQGR